MKSQLTFILISRGVITSGMAIYDTMQFINAPTQTIVMGQACSMGSFPAQAGEPRKRFVLPISPHNDLRGGALGMQSDIEILNIKKLQDLKQRLTELYVKHNTKGKPIKTLNVTWTEITL